MCWRLNKRSTAVGLTRKLLQVLAEAARNGKEVTAVIELRGAF